MLKQRGNQISDDSLVEVLACIMYYTHRSIIILWEDVLENLRKATPCFMVAEEIRRTNLPVTGVMRLIKRTARLDLAHYACTFCPCVCLSFSLYLFFGFTS